VRVLYLEDSEADAALVEALLAEAGIACKLDRVETPETFAAALDEGGFGIILSDNNLPSYDGFSALARARECCPDIPFIFVSGTLGEEAAIESLAIESLKAGATDYVLKQRLSRLVPAVQRALAEAAVRAASKRHAERVHQLAFYDPITGLPNRALLEDRLRTALARASRAAGGWRCCSWTWIASRRSTIRWATRQAMRSCARSPSGSRAACAKPTARRAGAATSSSCWSQTSPEIGKPLRKRWRWSSRRSTRPSPSPRWSRAEIEVSTSIGVTLYPWDGTNVTDLIKRADTAMYQAKDRGGNTYQFFTEAMDAAARERLFLDNELRRALRRGELALHYQPQVQTRDTRIVGAEALLRWKHPERAWISPAKFIPVAEETGQIHAIGRWVIEEALRQIKHWMALGLSVPRIDVNVSPRQLTDPSFVHTLSELLSTHGLPPRCLGLELTEGAMVEERTLVTVMALSQLGVGLAVDDFGTGYSSLGYLSRFPIDTLKIDQSFVRGLTIGPSDAALVKAIIAMGKSLRLRIIAEGVETEAQRLLLSQYGCYRCQGFLFDAALPAEVFATRLSP